MSFLKSENELVLAHRDMSHLSGASRYDLMLTPQHYVLKKEALPIAYAFQAKRVAPSILEELTGDGEWEYAVFREEESWVFVAYETAKLTTLLQAKGIAPEQVGQIYFAQQARRHFALPVALGEAEALAVVDGTVTIVPTALLGETSFGQFSGDFRPEKGFVSPHPHSSLLSFRHAVGIAVLLGLLAVGYLAEGMHYRSSLAQVEAEWQSVTEKYPDLQNKYVRESDYKKYKSIDKQQRTLRERLKAISKLVSKDSKIDQLTLNDKQYDVTIATNAKKSAMLQKIAKEKHLEGNNKPSSHILRFQGEI